MFKLKTCTVHIIILSCDNLKLKSENTFTYTRVLAYMLANITDMKMSFYVKRTKYVHLCIKNIVWVTFCQLEHYLRFSGPYCFLKLMCSNFINEDKKLVLISSYH